MHVRRKALLIGINYYGSQHQLSGCINDTQNMAGFLVSRGYSTDPRDMVVLTDERRGPYYPTGHNILAAMDWLVSEEGTCCFLHYSGHGGQVPDPDGDRPSGYDDTIVPVDFEQNGQISSDTLHRTLVSRLPPNSTLFIIFDCCHSGSAVELPYVYRTDEDGNINVMDNLEAGMQLMGEAEHLIQGDFTFQRLGEAKQLWGAATDFFHGLKHEFAGEHRQQGPGFAQADDFQEDWATENKSVFMFSGCRDDQTSADAFIGGRHVGAMSWAFLECMKVDYGWNMSYVEKRRKADVGSNFEQILMRSRQLLQDKYSQIPQLSVGYQFNLDRPMRI